MRLTVALLLVAVLMGALYQPAGATSRSGVSENVEVISSTDLRWKVSPDYQGGEIYMSELAFRGRLIVASVQGDHTAVRPPGDLGEAGLATFRISRDRDRVTQLGTVRCHSLGEITLWKNLVTQGSVRSTAAGTTGSEDECDRNGLRIMDVSDPAGPKVTNFLHLPCGVIDHAVVPQRGFAYIYAPSTCDQQTENVFNAGVFSEMSVVRIDPRHPQRSGVVRIVDLRPHNGCSEVAVHPQRALAVCVGDTRFILLDVSDPAAPRAIGQSMEAAGGLISPSFTWDGGRLVVGDEAMPSGETGGRSRVLIFDIEDETNPVQAGTWTAPDLPGNDQKIYSISSVPMRDGRDVIAVAHGNLGFWLLDITDPSSPIELAYLTPSEEDVQPGVDPERPTRQTFGTFAALSAYWYNGRFYLTDLDRLHVLRTHVIDGRNTHFYRGAYNAQTLIPRFQ